MIRPLLLATLIVSTVNTTPVLAQSYGTAPTPKKTLESPQTVASILQKIRPGNFISGYRADYGGIALAGYFQILTRGSEVRLIDVTNKITYAMDLSKSEEQELPEAYYTFLRGNYPTKSAASVLKKITLSNPRTNGEKDQLVATLKIYLEYSSAFGSMSAVVEMEALLELDKIDSYMQNANGQGGQMVKGQLLRVRAGDNIRLVEFNGPFGSFTNTIGMIMDFGLRIGGLGLRSSSMLQRIP